MNLEKVIEYLKSRALDVTNSPDEFIKQQTSVIPTNEVFSVFEMIQTGEFEKFVEEQKNNLPDNHPLNNS
jgi:hypothetical protein